MFIKRFRTTFKLKFGQNFCIKTTKFCKQETPKIHVNWHKICKIFENQSKYGENSRVFLGAPLQNVAVFGVCAVVSLNAIKEQNR